MVPIALSDRQALAEKLRNLKQSVAEAVTDEFFELHPDWQERYGELGRKRGIEDACFHVDFLAGAVESGTPTPFEGYARWTVRMLGARQIPSHFVVENLGQVGRALGSRLSSPEHMTVISFIRAGCEACNAAPSHVPVREDQTSLGLSQSLFLQAILSGQRKAAITIVSEAFREGHPVLDIYVEVLQESLYQVGRSWELNELTVAEEHMATAITQYVIAQIYSLLPMPVSRRGNLVVTGVAGELHQVGANMVADVLESQGYDVRFLGTNMPNSGILQEIEKHRTDMLGISATMLFNVPAVIRLNEEVRGRFGSRVPRIVLGGAAFRNLASLSAELGAVGIAADLRSAVRLLCP
jgi:MerR family transcriptional regulator, light-induced transcriptional regulator